MPSSQHQDEPNLKLESRDGFPDALRILLREYPREAWHSHTNFGGLIQFWMERHVMFRRLLETMNSDIEHHLDAKIDTAQYASRLSRYGSMFVNQLHGHHHIEDEHYFPRLATKDNRLTSGFSILDADHHALDEHLHKFTLSANALLNSPSDQLVAGDLHTCLGTLDTFLNRHLVDEEELVVPIILKYGPEEF